MIDERFGADAFAGLVADRPELHKRSEQLQHEVARRVMDVVEVAMADVRRRFEALGHELDSEVEWDDDYAYGSVRLHEPEGTGMTLDLTYHSTVTACFGSVSVAETLAAIDDGR